MKKLVSLRLAMCLFIFGALAAPAYAADYAPEVSKRLDAALKYFDDGQYSSAKSEYIAALRLEPKCPEAYNGLGLCAGREGRLADSEEHYLSALRLDPKYFYALYNLANVCYLEGASAQAQDIQVKKYNDAISFYLRATRVLKEKHKEPGADILTSLATVYRDKAKALAGLAKDEESKRAIKTYSDAIKADPKYPNAHAELGRLLLDRKEYVLAEKELRRAVTLKPDYSYPYYCLGRLYQEKREYPAALLAFHNSLKCEKREDYKQETMECMVQMGIPKQAVDHFAQGYEDLNCGRWDDAISEFDAASSAAPSCKMVALNNLGYAQYRAGNSELALETFKNAIAADSQPLPELFYNQGQIYLQKKDLAEAEKCFRSCLKAARGNSYLAHNALGVILKNKGELEKALDEYTMAVLQSGGSVSVVEFNRAVVLEKLGRKAEAADSYKKYLQASPSGVNADLARKRVAELH
jgi:tetratricopeptide (TPR) repeat protein